MANENDQVALSPTVLHVVEQFVAAMRADAVIANEAIDRLDQLLRKGVVPKLEDINAALFPPSEGKT